MRKSFFFAVLGLALTITPVLYSAIDSSPGIAHEVETAGNVGATIHVEPNDRPRAGTSSLVWFALVKRGGQAIPLSDCNCALSVYAQPRRSGDRPLQQPALSATSAEGRSNLPSARVTFPRAGTYDVVLRGSPKTPGAFNPFQLSYTVTVAQ
ncbi:hypothetical protein [Leptolyngbya ohadii]|uniref:hypothetical protein n=1 Tax=Leptolyngbya ohadii TaxID=1962290 RepID=UPI001CEC98B7|nr:hypothetical protein [Leptolyngbya ohadii]